jgi:hypothetical protein
MSLRNHQETVLVLCALFFLAALVAYVGWAITMLTGNLAQAITLPKGDERSVTFHFAELRKLQLPGVE